MKKKFTNWQRILRIMNFNHKRGLNSERVNEIYRKINLIRLENDTNSSLFYSNDLDRNGSS